jgi:peroxiredoxin
MMKKYYAAIVALLLIFTLGGCKPQDPGNETATTPIPTAATPIPTATSLSSNEELISKYKDSLQSKAEMDFTLQDLDGKEWKLSDLKGKIVLLNFWATWCPPCQMEMPEFQKLYDRFGSDGDVVILAVASTSLEGQSAEVSKDSVSEFVKGQKFTFPVLFDTDGSVWKQYIQPGIPANYIIDRQGNIRLLVAGAFKDENYLYAALEAVRRAESGQ